MKNTKSFTVSVNGQAAVDAGSQYVGNRCYAHILGGQIEVVVDDPGTYRGRPNKWVDVAYIDTVDEARAIVSELARIGMSGCYYVIAAEDDDSPNGPEETVIEDGTIPQPTRTP